jgi:hypothetical protein
VAEEPQNILLKMSASLINTLVKSDTTLKLIIIFSGLVWRDPGVDSQQTKSAEFFMWCESCQYES